MVYKCYNKLKLFLIDLYVKVTKRLCAWPHSRGFLTCMYDPTIFYILIIDWMTYCIDTYLLILLIKLWVLTTRLWLYKMSSGTRLEGEMIRIKHEQMVKHSCVVFFVEYVIVSVMKKKLVYCDYNIQWYIYY